MSDLIRRSDAIGACAYETLECYEARKAIRALPSADRPRGAWETVGEKTPYKRCPFCKRVRAFPDTRFCDWCGAKMKGVDDE